MTKSNTLYKDWSEETLSDYRRAFKTINPNWVRDTGRDSEGDSCYTWYNTQHPFSGQFNVKMEAVNHDWDKAWDMVMEHVKELENE